MPGKKRDQARRLVRAAGRVWKRTAAVTAAASAPRACAAIKAGASPGAMPENVVVKARARVTAGLAKLVDAVNQ